METNEKTLLEKIIEQKATQIAAAIAQAVESGAKVERKAGGSILVNDNVFVQKPGFGQHCDAVIVLELNSPELSEIMATPVDILEKKKAELMQQMQEIDKQIKSQKK